MKKMMMVSTVALALAGCGSPQADRTLAGAALGGLTGAAIGGLAVGTGGGAAAGAAIGALGGAAIGAASAQRHYHCYIDYLGWDICRIY